MQRHLDHVFCNRIRLIRRQHKVAIHRLSESADGITTPCTQTRSLVVQQSEVQRSSEHIPKLVVLRSLNGSRGTTCDGFHLLLHGFVPGVLANIIWGTETRLRR